jgi:hypothetical protein
MAPRGHRDVSLADCRGLSDVDPFLPWPAEASGSAPRTAGASLGWPCEPFRRSWTAEFSAGAPAPAVSYGPRVARGRPTDEARLSSVGPLSLQGRELGPSVGRQLALARPGPRRSLGHSPRLPRGALPLRHAPDRRDSGVAPRRSPRTVGGDSPRKVVLLSRLRPCGVSRVARVPGGNSSPRGQRRLGRPASRLHSTLRPPSGRDAPASLLQRLRVGLAAHRNPVRGKLRSRAGGFSTPGRGGSSTPSPRPFYPPLGGMLCRKRDRCGERGLTNGGGKRGDSGSTITASPRGA